MEVITLYRIKRENEVVSISPNKPTEGSYTETFRLIADEGKVLTDGTNTFSCIDTDNPEKYTEIIEASEGDYSEAGKILLGVSE